MQFGSLINHLHRFVEFFRTRLRVSDHRHDLRYLWLGAFVGLASGVVAIGFRETISFLTFVFFGAKEHTFLQLIGDVPIYIILLVPIAGGAFVAWFSNRFAPEAKGHGVPEIMSAIATNRGVIAVRVMVVKLIASAVSIGSGFSVGREGPTALIGASVGSIVGQVLRLPLNQMKMIVGCGAAAGIAATFNAPLAGAIFALELVVGNFRLRYLTTIIFAAMLGTVVTHNYYGEFHDLFSTIHYELKHPLEILSYAGLGVICGLLGIGFTKLLYWAEDLAGFIPWPAAVKGALGGLGIALLLVFIPILSGPATWDAITNPLSTVMNWRLMWIFLGLALFKMLATSFSLAMGASGGIFSPSLMIGGSLGAGYGFLVGKILPNYTDAPSSYALVGMGAFVAGITQAPLTAIAIIFEMTNNMSIMLPLIVSGTIALGVYNHFLDSSIYTMKLKRRGLILEWGRETGILETIQVARITVTEDEWFEEKTALKEIIAHFSKSTRSTLPVIDANKKLVGILSFWDVKEMVAMSEAESSSTAADLMRREFKFVTPEQNLYEAFAKISSGDYDYLPVVEDKTSMQLTGRLRRHRLLEIYKNQLTARGIIASS